jgi:hypothetical protein
MQSGDTVNSCLFMLRHSTFQHVLLLQVKRAWDISQYTGWTMKMIPAFHFARVLVIFSLVLIHILCRVFEQLVNSHALTTFNTFCDGISFQHLATVLISEVTLYY